MLLEANGLVGGYGKLDILKGVSLGVDAGQIAVVIGPNGAGKSTALKAIFGLIPLRAGEVRLQGEAITGERPDRVAGRGLSMVPQTDNVFPSLTVEENLEMGAYRRHDDLAGTVARVFEIFPPLVDRRRQPAGELSGGQRQMLAMGRALMSEPVMLLLDEPTAGLSPAYVDQIFTCIHAIRRLGVGILMVEQNARAALAIADLGYVLVGGENRQQGTGASLLADPEVARSFLGG